MARLNMFPGLADFQKVVREYGKEVPPEKMDAFFKDLDETFRQASRLYANQIIARNDGPNQCAGDEIIGLQKALKDTKERPFSEVISPYVNPENGTTTQLGERLIMSRELAALINGPSSEIVSLMKSLTEFGITFETMAKASYEAFDYAKAGIAISQSGPAKPLFWLPLGNSLFVTQVRNFMETRRGDLTVVNLGAGPGGLEKLFVDNASFGNRLQVVSVEMDNANLQALRKVGRSLQKHVIVNGDLARQDIQGLVNKVVNPDSTKFVVAGYMLHHVAPENYRGIIRWMNQMAGRDGMVQIHDVSGGVTGGGQSNVNRLIFNFMTAYHLLVFPPDSYYTESGFSMMQPVAAQRSVETHPELFVPGTTPSNANTMLTNGSIVVFQSVHRA